MVDVGGMYGLHHQHQRLQAVNVEVLDVVAILFLRCHKENLVVARMERPRLRIGKDIILPVYHG